MGVKKPGLLLMCHGDFPWNFFTDPRNRKLYEDCLSAASPAREAADQGDEYTRLSAHIASSMEKSLGLNCIELSYLHGRRPAIKQAISRATARGSRNIVCMGAAGLMAPAHSTSECLPDEIRRVVWDNPALDIVYAEPCINETDAARLIDRSIKHAFEETTYGPEQYGPEHDPGGQVEEDTGVVLVSANDHQVAPGDAHAAEFIRTAAMLSSRSSRWHDAGVGSEIAEFLAGVSSKIQSEAFIAVETGFIDFSSPGIEEAALRLTDRGADHIIAAALPALLHRHPLSVISPAMAVEYLQKTFPYLDILYVKPDPEPVADLLAARMKAKVLDAQRFGDRIRPDYKKAPTF